MNQRGAQPGHPKYGGRKKGTTNKRTAEQREATQDFFARIMSDEREAELWDKFMSEGAKDPVQFQAFKRAVEYKRGMPVQPHSGVDGAPIAVKHSICFGDGK